MCLISARSMLEVLPIVVHPVIVRVIGNSIIQSYRYLEAFGDLVERLSNQNCPCCDLLESIHLPKEGIALQGSFMLALQS